MSAIVNTPTMDVSVRPTKISGYPDLSVEVWIHVPLVISVIELSLVMDPERKSTIVAVSLRSQPMEIVYPVFLSIGWYFKSKMRRWWICSSANSSSSKDSFDTFQTRILPSIPHERNTFVPSIPTASFVGVDPWRSLLLASFFCATRSNIWTSLSLVTKTATSSS
ncbi:hypothetical protein OGAPHI_004424 [Ogataea philodendri]|uniref:Uncharacterized protein n=1 Tax=Ogataea philodendri TaxID=1378263 RepID=A0A9P8P735_9ASCO|nr:uncharacterized protein OGAPHI_004424 [Ogataea philodendri]KAH3666235.1 hypothetical protein OGAPHI_004424 [Ogataea philodendri]